MFLTIFQHIEENIFSCIKNQNIAKIRGIMKLCQMIFNKVPTQNSISDNINNKLVNATIAKNQKYYETFVR